MRWNIVRRALSLSADVRKIESFAGPSLTNSIWQHQHALEGSDSKRVAEFCKRTGIDESLLAAAFAVKRAAAQINVTIHCLGIVSVLPKILEDGESVESLSLGAGNKNSGFG